MKRRKKKIREERDNFSKRFKKRKLVSCRSRTIAWDKIYFGIIIKKVCERHKKARESKKEILGNIKEIPKRPNKKRTLLASALGVHTTTAKSEQENN